MSDIVPSIYNGDHLEDDFKVLLQEPSTVRDVALLNVFLDQVSGCEEAKWQLLKWNGTHESNPYFNCKAISCFQSSGFNAYRIRPLKSRLQKYRIIYAFDKDDNSIHFLAVVIAVKDSNPPPPPEIHYDYSENHPISTRIRQEYSRNRIAEL